MSRSLRIAAVAAATGMALGTSDALADGYYVGSVKDTAPAPAPEIYEWNGLSIGAGIGVGILKQDATGWAKRTDELEKCRLYDKWKYLGIGKVIEKCDDYKKWHEVDHLKPSTLIDTASDNSWSAFGTLQVGYDRLITDRILIGAFADFDFYRDADLDLSDKDYHHNKLRGTLNGRVERDSMWSVGWSSRLPRYSAYPHLWPSRLLADET